MTEQGLALSALFQSAALVDDLAYRRPVQDEDQLCLLHGLFVFDPLNIEQVYKPACLRYGRDVARACLQQSERLHLINYAGAMVALQTRLAQRPDSSQSLKQGLNRIHLRAAEQSLLHLDQLQAMARLYSELISPLSPRIMVQGDPHALQDVRTVANIRSLLLAGIRAARLWTQTGGGRWQLVFRRGKLLKEL